MSLLENGTFCILPFVHAATLTDGSMPLCCVADKSSDVNLNDQILSDYWKSGYVKDARARMLKGKPVSACHRCYEEEKNGYRSHRVIETQNWISRLGEERFNEMIKNLSENGAESEEIISIDLRLGNTCNLQCVMCQPRDSSKWNGASDKFMKEIRDIKLLAEWKYKSRIKSEMFEWYKNGSFWENLKTYLPGMKEIIVGGGEPMLIKEHLEFIRYCADSGEASHIHLRYHTNLTIFPVEMIPYWEKFQCVEFFASIDGMNEIGNFVRYPSRWGVVQKHLDILDGLPANIWLRILTSVHALNVHHVPDFLRWVKQRDFQKRKQQNLKMQTFVHPGLVHWPEYMNVKALPADYKRTVTREWAALREEFAEEPFDFYESIIQFMNSEDWTNKTGMLKSYVAALDKTRGTDFYSVFPELSETL